MQCIGIFFLYSTYIDIYILILVPPAFVELMPRPHVNVVLYGISGMGENVYKMPYNACWAALRIEFLKNKTDHERY